MYFNLRDFLLKCARFLVIYLPCELGNLMSVVTQNLPSYCILVAIFTTLRLATVQFEYIFKVILKIMVESSSETSEIIVSSRTHGVTCQKKIICVMGTGRTSYHSYWSQLIFEVY